MAIDKQAILGGFVRGAMSGASGIRIAHWVKQRPGRGMALKLHYPGGQAEWSIVLTEADQTQSCNVSSSTLEGAMALAVVALGKDF
jgi:hypothetical protein